MIETRNAQAAQFSASTLHISYSRTVVDMNVNIQIQQPKFYQPSDDALSIMGYVAHSDRLTGHEKSAIVKLLAMADAHTTGKTHDRLMKTIGALVGLMEFSARMRAPQPRHSLEDVLGYYQQQRRLLDPNGGVETTTLAVNMHMEVEQFSLQYTALSVDAALEKWDALVAQDAAQGPSLPTRVEGVGAGAGKQVDTCI